MSNSQPGEETDLLIIELDRRLELGVAAVDLEDEYNAHHCINSSPCDSNGIMCLNGRCS